MSDDQTPPGDQPPRDKPEVLKFRRFPPDRVAAQKRLAVQLVGQMPLDDDEQSEVIRYMGELITWQQDGNGGEPWNEN